MGIWIVFIDFLLEQGLKVSQGLLSSLVILQITLDLGLTSRILKSKLKSFQALVDNSLFGF